MRELAFEISCESTMARPLLYCSSARGVTRALLTSDDDDVVCGFLSLFLACGLLETVGVRVARALAAVRSCAAFSTFRTLSGIVIAPT